MIFASAHPSRAVRWNNACRAIPTNMSASPVAPPFRNGRANAMPAAPGTPWSKKRSPARRRCAPAGWARENRTEIQFVRWPARPKAWRAGLGIAEFDRAIGGGLVPGGAADRRRPRHRQIDLAAATCRSARAANIASPISPARNRSIRCGCAAIGLACRKRRWAWPPPPRSAISPPRSMSPTARMSWSSIPIQTMYVDTLDSAPGTVAQVRASAQI